MKKLEENFGIRETTLKLLRSYLNNCCQYTKIGVDKSFRQQISYGVSQEFSSGPLLFLMLINNMLESSQFETVLFADDAYSMLVHKI